MLFRAFVVIVAAFLLIACERSAGTAPSANQKRYPLKGIVVTVDPDAKKAKVDHEPIEGFMDAMTMEFPIYEDWVWSELAPGAEIRAELVVDSSAKEPYWLEKVGIVAAAKPGQAAPSVDPAFTQVGLDAPDFALTNQDGKKITLRSFRGKALAITFIYARCPLPEYCIQMSANFSDLANLLNEDPKNKDKFALLSISFDPENDTPAKLRSYGLGYMGKDAKELGVWSLAVGTEDEVRKVADFYGLRYEVDANDKTQINHSLRTIVIAPDGKVSKIYAGNEWTKTELRRELEAAAASK